MSRTGLLFPFLVAHTVVIALLAGCGGTPVTAPPSAKSIDASSPSTPETTPAAGTGSESTSPAPTKKPTKRASENDSRPSVSTAEDALLRIAKTRYPKIPWVGVRIVGIGEDSKGLWWVQGWTTASSEYQGESGEQWFVTYDGSDWTYRDSGTGMERSDYPSDIVWEDAP